MSDITQFTCTSCKLSTWSMYDLSSKEHIECPQGKGQWEKSDHDQQVGESWLPDEELLTEFYPERFTVTVHVSPDCQPETLQALSEMMKCLIKQVASTGGIPPKYLQK